MKKSIFTLVMFCCALMGKAQVTDEQSAILQVGDEAQIFYGVDALVNAVAAAPDRGGVVTLSSGTFNGATITKCVDIYGAGWVEQKVATTGELPIENSILPTIIQSKIIIKIEGIDAPHNIHIEGLKFNNDYQSPHIDVQSAIDGLEIVKCQLTKGFSLGKSTHVTMIQCYFAGGIGNVQDLSIQNCWLAVNQIAYSSVDAPPAIIDHCFVGDGYYFYNGSSKFLCTNSIVHLGAAGRRSGSTIYRNCMLVDWTDGLTGWTDNWYGVDISKVFKDGTNASYSDARTFELTDEAKATYIGSDGTEVGMNGGNFPWNKTPHTPLVKDLKLSIDGTQLKVNYNAETR